MDKINYAKKIQAQYINTPKEKNYYEKLKEIDKKVKKPVTIFSYIFGSVSSLILGTGMCIAMGVIGGLMSVGIVIGLAGIGMMAATYPLHKKILNFRKEKYSEEVLKLSNEVIESSDYQSDKNQTKTKTKISNDYEFSSNYKTNSLEK